MPPPLSPSDFNVMPTGSTVDMFPTMLLTTLLNVPATGDQTLQFYPAPTDYFEYVNKWGMLQSWLKDNLMLGYLDNLRFIWYDQDVPFTTWITSMFFPLQYQCMICFPFKNYGAGGRASQYGQGIIVPNYALTDLIYRFNRSIPGA